MKNIILIAIIISTMLLSACSSDENPQVYYTIKQYSGEKVVNEYKHIKQPYWGYNSDWIEFTINNKTIRLYGIISAEQE